MKKESIILRNNDLNIRQLDFIQADYLDGQGQKNILNLSRDKKIYTLSGDIFNADRLIENILMSDEEKILSNDNFELILNIYNHDFINNIFLQAFSL